MDGLPFEVLWRIFGFLDFNEILPIRHVDRTWRTIATTHPFFWSEVYVTSRVSSLHLALLRVAAAGKRSFLLDIKLIDRPHTLRLLDPAIRLMHRNFMRSLLLLLRMALQGVKTLRLVIHERYAPAICSALLYPAPKIELFKLRVFNKSGDVNVAIPSRLFNGHAPNLKALHLYEVDVTSSIPVALSQARNVTLSYSPGSIFPFPPPPIVHFPVLEDLTLLGGHIQFGYPPAADVLKSLSRVDLHMDVGTIEELHRFCLEFEHLLEPLIAVSFFTPSISDMDILLGHVKTPWVLSIIGIVDRAQVKVEVFSELSGKVRGFCEYMLPECSTVPAFFVDGHDRFRHVRCLKLATSAWTVIHKYLPVLENLEEIQVYIDTLELPCGKLGCVRGPGPLTVRLDLESQQECFCVTTADFKCFLETLSPIHTSLHMDPRIVIVA